MYFYKIWTSDFIQHVRIPHSIPRHFLDRGFSGWRAQNWASIVLCPTNSTQNSALYKLTSGPAGWMAQHCTPIVLCHPNNSRSSAIYKLTDRTPGLAASRLRLFTDKLTDGLQGWRPQDCVTGGLAGWLAQHCTSIVLCPPNNTRSSAMYKLTDGLQGWRGQDCDCLRMVIPINYLTLPKNIIFNTKVLILNIDIVQFNYIKLLKDVKYLI
jgi:hypothetical protein